MGLFQNTTFGQVAAPATNLIGSFINNYAAKKAQERENKANRQMAEYQYSKDLEMWNRQNEYNNPQSQMERFKAAGLNPNLIYGQGNAGNASTLPKYSAPTIKERSGLPDITGVLPAYQDYQIKQAQVDNVTANTRLQEEKATSEAVNRAMSQFHLDKNKWMWEGGLNKSIGNLYETGDKHRYHEQGRQKWFQSYLKTGQMEGALKLQDYNTQIAEQMLKMRIKDNAYYFWKNVGAGASRGIGNMFKFVKGKGFVPKKGVAPKLKTPTIPKGFNYNNRANRAFQQSVNPW